MEEAIRPGGLAPTKSLRLKAMLAEILRRRGSFDLSFLREMPLDEAEEWLRSLPGVGPKTAAVVLLFSLGRPAFPVDTHVHRVLRRLGLAPARASATQAQAMWQPRLAPEEVYRLSYVPHRARAAHLRGAAAALPGVQPEASLSVGDEFYPSLERGRRALRRRLSADAPKRRTPIFPCPRRFDAIL